MTGSVGFSLLGFATHTVLEFGPAAGLLALENGFIPMAALQAGLLVAWLQMPVARTVSAGLLLTLGFLHLAGGSLISVLPLAFLPFEPAQTVEHYRSHVIYGVTQLPLIVIGGKELWGRGDSR
jgi:hypothetical protein